jgi:hypothetical protein
MIEIPFEITYEIIFGILFINVYLWIVQSVCQSSKYVRKRSKVS